MDARPSVQEKAFQTKQTSCWQIRFTQSTKSPFGWTGVISFCAVLVWCAVFLVDGILKWDVGSISINLVAMVLFSLLVFLGSPWRRAVISHDGDRLRVFIKGGIGGLYDISRTYHIPEIISWSYSEKTRRLGIEHTYQIPGERVRAVDWVSLNGLRPGDLSFLLDWLERHFKDDPSLENK